LGFFDDASERLNWFCIKDFHNRTSGPLKFHVSESSCRSWRLLDYFHNHIKQVTYSRRWIYGLYFLSMKTCRLVGFDRRFEKLADSGCHLETKW